MALRISSDSTRLILPWEWGAMMHQNDSKIDWRNGSNSSDFDHLDHPDHTPYSILFLFVVFAVGAFVRFLLKRIRLPYTVVLFVLGALLGLVSSRYEVLQKYTSMARIHPQLILFIFLPVLIFESAFAMEAHTFIRTFGQSLLLAVPGLLICTGLTAVLAVHFFTFYDWSWTIALLFGSILSATDPVAVVALLREIGTSKTLSTLIEGESLLNDGSAIVVYMVLIELVVPGANVDGVSIVKKFCQISLGGPALGFVMGKIAVFCLSHIFNDAIIAITLTLSAAYITYYLSEAVLHVSGVLALVALGVVISSEKENISPEIEKFVHRFWENLSYFANTVIFVVAGIVITEVAADDMEKQDIFLVFATYVGITVFRLMMIGALSPALSRLGYGLSWKDAVVMTWGGLRGAVGLALGLSVSEHRGIEQIGKKILIHVAGIVLLTLLVNATTIKALLRMLGMSEVSKARQRNMTLAMKHLKAIQERSIHVQKNNQILTDADWKHVESNTTLKNPYSSPASSDQIAEDAENIYNPVRFSVCPECTHHHFVDPDPKELEEMHNEARLRVIDAQKISFWKQFENGLLATTNVRVLLAAADMAADKAGSFITVFELRKHWKIPVIYEWLSKRLLRKQKIRKSSASSKPSVTGCWAQARQMIFHPLFEVIVCAIIILNLIPIIWEMVLRFNATNNMNTLKILNYVDFAFILLYICEFLGKLTVLGPIRLLQSHWNKFDLAILVIALSDMILRILMHTILFSSEHIQVLRLVGSILGLLRALRLLRLLKLLRRKLLDVVNMKINSYLYDGYDIGCGFLLSVEEGLKMIEETVDYPPIAKELLLVFEQHRVEILKELAHLQQIYPSVAVAVKSRHASRHVLNCSREEVHEMKKCGKLEDNVYEELLAGIEEQMKHLLNSPTSILPKPALDLLKNVQWISDNEEIFNYLKSKASVMKFQKGEVLGIQGDAPSGIYVITVGIVKIEGTVTDNEDGSLPNTDTFHWFRSQGYVEDFLIAGNVLGELGVLTQKPRSTTAVCETEVQAFHINQLDIDKAFLTFSGQVNLEYRIWRSCALRIAQNVLRTNVQYDSWSKNRIMMHLQKAFLPDLRTELNFDIESHMQDVILIQGKAVAAHSGEVYVGASYIPRTVSSLDFEICETNRPVMVVIGAIDSDEFPQLDWATNRERWSICPPVSRCLLHQVRYSISARGQSPTVNSNLRANSKISMIEQLPFNFRRSRALSQPIIQHPRLSKESRHSPSYAKNGIFKLQVPDPDLKMSEIPENGGTNHSSPATSHVFIHVPTQQTWTAGGSSGALSTTEM